MSARNLSKIYTAHGKTVVAVSDVSFDIFSGEVLGIIGESGSGKSTLARLLVGLEESNQGYVYWKRKPVNTLGKEIKKEMQQEVQMVFQDAAYVLCPVKKVNRIFNEVIHLYYKVSKDEKEQLIEKVLADVGLSKKVLNKYPMEFSGGERQRLNIAKALLAKPKLLICDEPVSALDISVQAKILNLLMALKDEYQLTMLFIAHSLEVIYHVSDRIGVMKNGQLVELGEAKQIIHSPTHKYTKTLTKHVVNGSI